MFLVLETTNIPKDEKFMIKFGNPCLIVFRVSCLKGGVSYSSLKYFK